MCGILGALETKFDRASVDAALTRLAWRGRDGAAVACAAGWRLGTARLAISDPTAAQPLICARTGRVVAFNGAVTSAREEWPIYETATRNDAELLLHRLEHDGPESLLDMTGPYAFAIADPVAGCLYLGRDHLGEKPLFVGNRAGSTIAFASTVAALRELGFTADWTPVELGRWFRRGFCRDEFRRDGPQQVRVVPPGLWRIDRDGAQRVHRSRSRRFRSGRTLRDALADATVRCADAEPRVGLSLSGGIDSACIAVCAAGRALPAYQFRANGEPSDERERAALVAERWGHTLRAIDGGPAILASLPELTRAAGRPLGDPSVLAAHAVARGARDDGVRVLLSGEGADDLLLGYRRHRVAARLPRPGARFWHLWRTRRPAWFGWSVSQTARLCRALGASHGYELLLDVTPPSFARAVLRGPAAEATPWPAVGYRSALAQARDIDRDRYLHDDLLPKLDVATLAAGVEGRCPFLDPEVVFSAAVLEPDPRRVLGKRALREAFADDLPARLFDRPKTGFAVPLDRWLREDAFLPDVLRDRRTRERGHVDGRGLERALDRHRSGRASCGHALYLVAAFELHLRESEGSA